MLVATSVMAQMAQMAGRGGDHMDWDDGSSWGMVIMMIVVAVVVVGAIVGAVVFASRGAPRGNAGAGASVGPSAREVLDQRYARGEIDTADYEERRSKLG